MSTKVFYHKKTLKIMGMSEDENAMDFPYVETEGVRHSTKNMSIKMVKKKPTLKIEGRKNKK